MPWRDQVLHEPALSTRKNGRNSGATNIGPSLVTGLAHMIVEGRLGPVDDKRARQLAIAITSVLGVGLIPRTEDVPDPYKRTTVRGTKKS